MNPIGCTHSASVCFFNNLTTINPTVSSTDLALPDHGDDGGGGHVLNQLGEEGLGGQILVVLLLFWFCLGGGVDVYVGKWMSQLKKKKSTKQTVPNP
jgi:hypothetical protein